ncbi:hypothetical protein ACHAWU_000318 [Discostella pseudostelligera]|uniref:Uncharacterized protein n=1 Tax=Discostella pseudostelligera TaxID=259834 RepID=A0ABD3MU84_9STRA
MNARRNSPQQLQQQHQQQRHDQPAGPPEPEPNTNSTSCTHDYPLYSWHLNNSKTMTATSRDETLILTRRGEVLVCRHRRPLRADNKHATGSRIINGDANNVAPLPQLNGNDETYSRSNTTPGRVWDHSAYCEPPTLDRLTINGNSNDHNNNNLHHLLPTMRTTARVTVTSESSPTPFSLFGVPTHLHHLSQIRITKISAHPRGQHVLLISTEGLLFSYGSNEFGQLGLGYNGSGTLLSSPPNSPLSPNSLSSPSSSSSSLIGSPKSHRQFEKTTVPSIVTSLLRNGGKSINCAAGIDYSLVVVKTEGSRRMIGSSGGGGPRNNHRHAKRQDPNGVGPQQNQQQQPNFVHHQMYGFGNNEHRKLGLHGDRQRRDDIYRFSGGGEAQEATFSPPSSPGSLADSSLDGMSEDASTSTTTCIYLPRRCALECTVVPECISSIPPYGIFSIAASIHHSTALVRRPSGIIELFAWGKDNAFGLESPISLPDSSEKQHVGEMDDGAESNRALSTCSLIDGDSTLPPPSSECLERTGESELDKKLRRHVHANKYADSVGALPAVDNQGAARSGQLCHDRGGLELWYEDY